MAFEKNLLRGSLDMMVLSTLVEGAMYGHLIQKKIREVTKGAVTLPPGTLYPLLHRLEAAGWIKVQQVKKGQGVRRWYSLTRVGSRRLQHQSSEWDHFSDCVRNCLKPALDRLGADDSPRTEPA